MHHIPCCSNYSTPQWKRQFVKSNGGNIVHVTKEKLMLSITLASITLALHSLTMSSLLFCHMVNITNKYFHSRWLQCSNAQNSNKALGLHYDMLGKKKDVFNFGNLDGPSMVKIGLETSLVNNVKCSKGKALNSNQCGSQFPCG